MTKYKVTFLIRRSWLASIVVEAENETALDEFIREFYPDTNWDYEVIE